MCSLLLDIETHKAIKCCGNIIQGPLKNVGTLIMRISPESWRFKVNHSLPILLKFHPLWAPVKLQWYYYYYDDDYYYYCYCVFYFFVSLTLLLFSMRNIKHICSCSTVCLAGDVFVTVRSLTCRWIWICFLMLHLCVIELREWDQAVWLVCIFHVYSLYMHTDLLAVNTLVTYIIK